MNDHDPTPEQELASAYLDGDVTSVERAHVDATPKLLALVASMREVRSLVAAVPMASDARRDMAIATALAQFDAIASGDNVVSLADRRRWPTRVMSAAAAVVLLGVVGISVLQRTGDDKSADTASRESDPKFEANTADDAVGAALPEAAGEVVLVAMESPIVIDDPQQLLVLTVPEPPAADTSPADTTAAGDDVDTQRGESSNVDALACMTDDQVFLADIYYQGTLAIAVRDTVTGVTEAIDSNCTVLASVTP